VIEAAVTNEATATAAETEKEATVSAEAGTAETVAAMIVNGAVGTAALAEIAAAMNDGAVAAGTTAAGIAASAEAEWKFRLLGKSAPGGTCSVRRSWPTAVFGNMRAGKCSGAISVGHGRNSGRNAGRTGRGPGSIVVMTGENDVRSDAAIGRNFGSIGGMTGATETARTAQNAEIAWTEGNVATLANTFSETVASC
jgi:hypothetical protein